MWVWVQFILLSGQPQPTISVEDFFTQFSEEFLKDASAVYSGPGRHFQSALRSTKAMERCLLLLSKLINENNLNGSLQISRIKLVEPVFRDTSSVDYSARPVSSIESVPSSARGHVVQYEVPKDSYTSLE